MWPTAKANSKKQKGRSAKRRGGGPHEANRTLQLLSSMFNRAKEWGILSEDAPNAASRVRRFPQRSRDRFVTPAELPRLLEGDLNRACPMLRECNRHAYAKPEYRSNTCETPWEPRGTMPGRNGGRLLVGGNHSGGRPSTDYGYGKPPAPIDTSPQEFVIVTR